MLIVAQFAPLKSGDRYLFHGGSIASWQSSPISVTGNLDTGTHSSPVNEPSRVLPLSAPASSELAKFFRTVPALKGVSRMGRKSLSLLL